MNEMRLRTRDESVWTARKLGMGDFERLLKFCSGLGERSKRLFCPYPWDDNLLLAASLHRAIDKSVEGIDASYLLYDQGGEPVGHFFLWKAGGNEHSRRFGVEVPELGVAIADSHQGRGLGRLSVAFLKWVAAERERDAIELTTAPDNAAGLAIYEKEGFEYIGDIRNPLEVDATEAALGRETAQKMRTERHLVYVIKELHRESVLDYLVSKKQRLD